MNPDNLVMFAVVGLAVFFAVTSAGKGATNLGVNTPCPSGSTANSYGICVPNAGCPSGYALNQYGTCESTGLFSNCPPGYIPDPGDPSGKTCMNPAMSGLSGVWNV